MNRSVSTQAFHRTLNTSSMRDVEAAFSRMVTKNVREVSNFFARFGYLLGVLEREESGAVK